MISTGDTERQAILRDRMIKRKKKTKGSRFTSKIIPFLKPEAKLLDIGCGTGHIIQELAMQFKSTFFIGLDVSPAMLRIAHLNAAGLPNIMLVQGDGLKLPFSSSSLDVVITRLAEYSPKEAYRILKLGSCFFVYGLGPEARKEIREFFPNRIDKGGFLFPKSLKNWKQEVCEHIKKTGFIITDLEDHKEIDYHQNEEELMDLIEMVPLVMHFERKKDRQVVEELAAKYAGKKGIRTTWHHYIIKARKR